VLAQLIRELYAKYKENPDESHKGSVVQFKKKNCDYQKYADIWGFKLFLLRYMHVSDFFQSHVFGGYCFWNQFVAFVDFVGIAGV